MFWREADDHFVPSVERVKILNMQVSQTRYILMELLIIFIQVPCVI
jgi:hypothetical protein